MRRILSVMELAWFGIIIAGLYIGCRTIQLARTLHFSPVWWYREIRWRLWKLWGKWLDRKPKQRIEL